ncbi:hypothetical protein N9A49_06260 [Salibacteraceae bacterium]|nr:hypothetical protein [Salibacteraceae bacterium]
MLILSILKGFLGISVLVGIGWLASQNRRAINWPLILKGIALQLVFAVLVLKVDFVASGFEWMSRAFVKVISFTQFGSEFLFKSFVSNKMENAVISFAFNVLPTIVFFSALSSILYYLGILQKFVFAFAWVMKRLMNLSGAESLAAAGNIFMGQTEALCLCALIWIE